MYLQAVSGDNMTFNKLGLKPEILKAIIDKGYRKATPIQSQSIPAILKGKDILGGAQTGTGKTAAFALPILELLSDSVKRTKKPRALILTPTRELADQVGESFQAYGQHLILKSTTIYGGVSINPQISTLKKGCDIIVATPGRLIDHINQKTINLSDIEILVLDEADRMLDMGFIRDIKKIIQELPKKRQNLLFSATYSNEIKKLAGEILKNPVAVEVTKRNTAAEKVEQVVHNVDKRQKRHLLAHLIKEQSWYQVLVFVRTKHGANRLATQLKKSGIPSSAIHGDKSQGARTRALKDFKQGDLQTLIATDIAARGIHLDDLSHVVNFDLPQVPEDYVHRIGRTGRAGKSGIAISLICPEDEKQLVRIEKLLKTKIPVEEVKSFTPVEIAPSEAQNSGKQQPRKNSEKQPQKNSRKPQNPRGAKQVKRSPGNHKNHGNTAQKKREENKEVSNQADRNDKKRGFFSKRKSSGRGKSQRSF